MDFLQKELQAYIENHTEKEPEILKMLNRETYAKILMPRMLSGHLQGRVLSMLSKMIKPKRILEIGTFTGYSAICLAEGFEKEGAIITIDVNEELEDMARSYFKRAGLEKIIDYRIGNAMEIIPDLKGDFDLIFIDADKENYCNYFDLVIGMMKPGAFLIADNVLWSGKVLDEEEINKNKDTKGIITFNKKIQDDERVENVLFPIRDGLMIIRKL